MEKFIIQSIKGATLEFDSFYYDVAIPLLPWNSKIYAWHDNQLKAIIPLAYYMVSTGDNKGSGVIVCKMAGHDGLYVNPKGWFTKYYESIEDYKNGVEYKPAILSLRKFLQSRGYSLVESGCWNRAVSAFQFWPAQNKACRDTSAKFKYLYHDATGTHFKFTGTNCSGKKVYFSAEECYADNLSDVLDFDDTQEPEEKEFVFNKKIVIRAKSEAEAEEIFKNMK